MPDIMEFLLNGSKVELKQVSPNLTLLEFLRRRGLTGAKEGCAEGDCGACSVVWVASCPDGQRTFRAVNSCLMPMGSVAGGEVRTAEGIGTSRDLHPVQKCMVDFHGSQCGYCTPGIICSMFEGFHREDLKTMDQMDDQLSGNLCRCTGYRPIKYAFAAALADRKPGETLQASDEIPPELSCPAHYQYDGEEFFRPAKLEELLELLARHPDARMVAGATELGLEITKRYKRFPKLICLEGVTDLRELRAEDSIWRIGAAVTLSELYDVVGEEYPELAEMLRVFGSRQIRNRATLGGNLATASPIGDCAPALLALDSKLVIASLNHENPSKARVQERIVPISEFFLAYRKTALAPGEVLKTVLIPRPVVPTGITRKAVWYKVSRRREMDISTVSAAFVLRLDVDEQVVEVRLAYGGVSATPVRALKTESFLAGRLWNDETLNAACQILSQEFQPISDVRGSRDYRLELITGLLRKFKASSHATVEDPSIADWYAREKVDNALPHESAHKHVSGEAVYVDDSHYGGGHLTVWPVCSPHAKARVLKRDASAARAMPGIHAVILAEDIPGRNEVGAVKHDEILLADKEVDYHGHLVAIVVGTDAESCRKAAEKVEVVYEPLAPLLSLREAVEKQSFHNEPNFIKRGDCTAALASAPIMLEGEFEFGGQEHFYLETNAAWARPEEDGAMFVVSSTQHPSEVQQTISHVLDIPAHRVTVSCPRMGGGFGGKETQAATPAVLAALAARATGRTCGIRWNRDQDMMITGHRHPFFARFKVGFDSDGMLKALQVELWSDGGWSQDLSQAVTDRALFHLDNAYYIPAVHFRGQVAKTNKSSNTAFRGFGGPQGMLFCEEIMDRVARKTGLPPEVVRERNLYHGSGETNTTPYGMEIPDNHIPAIWKSLKELADFDQRRAEIARWNALPNNPPRGIAITPVKFGISFTITHLNQAGALVLIYQDGSVQVNHGGTEMGQGLHTNIASIVCTELGLLPDSVRVMHTSTDKVPNTSPTAASSGTDLNGAAARNASVTLRERLLPIAATLLKEKLDREIPLNEICFQDGFATFAGEKIKFAEICRRAYFERVNLSASGFYSTPGIKWDRAAGRGRPFHYFSYGAAVSEVEIDPFTGMHRLLRVDILHDVGTSLNKAINRGQIEGGFIQGMGWMTMEELVWDDKGRLLTHSPDTYKIPSSGDTPPIFNVHFRNGSVQEGVVIGSKAVGEPPIMLAFSVREAIRDAVASRGPGCVEAPLACPATAEAILRALRHQSTLCG